MPPPSPLPPVPPLELLPDEHRHQDLHPPTLQTSPAVPLQQQAAAAARAGPAPRRGPSSLALHRADSPARTHRAQWAHRMVGTTPLLGRPAALPHAVPPRHSVHTCTRRPVTVVTKPVAAAFTADTLSTATIPLRPRGGPPPSRSLAGPAGPTRPPRIVHQRPHPVAAGTGPAPPEHPPTPSPRPSRTRTQPEPRQRPPVGRSSAR